MSYVVGIDLGTTNFAICVVENGRPKMLQDGQQHTTFPSAVFRKDGTWLVGYDAKIARLKEPQLGAYAVKRLMGLKYDSPDRERLQKTLGLTIRPLEDGNCGVLLGKELFSPTQIAAEILKFSYELVKKQYPTEEPEEVVITVPAYFNHAQRQATKDAATLANLPCERIINEPTAAAVAYGMRVSQEAKALVFDLGGGTFDVSILHFVGGVVQILAVCGDSFLGGEDFDMHVVEYLKEQLRDKYPEDISGNDFVMRRLKEAAETAKCELSFQQSTMVLLPQILPNIDLQTSINRVQLQKMTQPLVDKVMSVVEQALHDAKLKANDIDRVILVGGQTRMPIIRERITQYFNQEPSKGVHPDEVVAKGAGLHASSLVGQADAPMLFDVTPFDLGIDVQAGLFQTIVPRNSRIPVAASEKFVLREGRRKTKIVVRQGHSRFSADNEFLGEFQVNNLELKPDNTAEVDVSFRLDSNGMLHVTAKDMVSNRVVQMKMKNYGEFIREEDKFSDQVVRDGGSSKAIIGVGDSSAGKGQGASLLHVDASDMNTLVETATESELQQAQKYVTHSTPTKTQNTVAAIEQLSSHLDTLAQQIPENTDFALSLELEDVVLEPVSTVSSTIPSSSRHVEESSEEELFSLSPDSLVVEEEDDVFTLELEPSASLESKISRNVETIDKKQAEDILDQVLHSGFHNDFFLPTDDFFSGLTQAVTGKAVERIISIESLDEKDHALATLSPQMLAILDELFQEI